MCDVKGGAIVGSICTNPAAGACIARCSTALASRSFNSLNIWPTDSIALVNVSRVTYWLGLGGSIIGLTKVIRVSTCSGVVSERALSTATFA